MIRSCTSTAVLLGYLSLFCASPALALDRTFTLQPQIVEAPLNLDGKLDEPCWNTEGCANGFITQETGVASEPRTEVRVACDHRAVYFAFRCVDPEVNGITGHQNRYDGDMSQEDYLEINLDTFLDHRSFYVFRFNMLGTRQDGRLSNNIRPDMSWDADWRVAVAREDGAWAAEVGIPFASLKIPGQIEQRWGVNFLRYRRASDDHSTWAPVGSSAWDASKFGVIEGIRVPPQPLRPQFSGYTSVTRDFASRRLGLQTRPGLDLDQPITNGLSAYVTLLPDFSQVESELVGLTLSDVEVRTAEKRPFFQEGSDLFPRSGVPLFWSKRLGEMDAGLRMYGTLGKSQLYLLNAQTAEPAQANHQVIKLQRPLDGRGSWWSANYIGKEAGTRGHSRSYGADARFILPGQMRLSLNFGASSNARFAGTANGLSIGLYRSIFPLTWYLQWQRFTPNLSDSAEDGFVTLDDIKGPRGFARYYWRNPAPFLQRTGVEIDGQYGTDRQGRLRRASLTIDAKADFTNRMSAVLVYDYLNSSVGRPRPTKFRDLRGALISYNVLQALGGQQGGSLAWEGPSGAQYPAFLFGALHGEVEEQPGMFFVGAAAIELHPLVRLTLQGERSPKRNDGNHEFSLRTSFDVDLTQRSALTVALRRENGERTNAYVRLRWNLARDRTMYVVYGEQESFNPTTGRFEQTLETRNRLFVKMAMGL